VVAAFDVEMGLEGEAAAPDEEVDAPVLDDPDDAAAELAGAVVVVPAPADARAELDAVVVAVVAVVAVAPAVVVAPVDVVVLALVEAEAPGISPETTTAMPAVAPNASSVTARDAWRARRMAALRVLGLWVRGWGDIRSLRSLGFTGRGHTVDRGDMGIEAGGPWLRPRPR
jgi:hypothetical protein